MQTYQLSCVDTIVTILHYAPVTCTAETKIFNDDEHNHLKDLKMDFGSFNLQFFIICVISMIIVWWCFCVQVCYQTTTE